MSRKVFITGEISFDENLIEASESLPVLPFIWQSLLPFFDDWGRAEARPVEIKAKVFPMFTIVSIADIRQGLELLHQHGLLVKYEVSGKSYIAIHPEKWFQYQTHIRGEKRRDGGTGSHFPCAPEHAEWWITAGASAGSAQTGDSAGTADQLREDARTCAQSREDARDCIPSPSPSPSPTSSNPLPPSAQGSEDANETLAPPPLAAFGLGDGYTQPSGRPTASPPPPQAVASAVPRLPAAIAAPCGESDPFGGDPYDPAREQYLPTTPRPSRKAPKAALSNAECVSAGESRFPAAIGWVIWKCQTEARCPAPWLAYRRALWEQIAAGEIPPETYEGFVPPQQDAAYSAGQSSANETETREERIRRARAIPPGAMTGAMYAKQREAEDTHSHEINERYLEETARRMGVDLETVRMFVDRKFREAVETGEYKLRDDRHGQIAEFSRFLGLEVDERVFWRPLQDATARMAA